MPCSRVQWWKLSVEPTRFQVTHVSDTSEQKSAPFGHTEVLFTCLTHDPSAPKHKGEVEVIKNAELKQVQIAKKGEKNN